MSGGCCGLAYESLGTAERFTMVNGAGGFVEERSNRFWPIMSALMPYSAGAITVVQRAWRAHVRHGNVIDDGVGHVDGGEGQCSWWRNSLPTTPCERTADKFGITAEASREKESFRGWAQIAGEKICRRAHGVAGRLRTERDLLGELANGTRRGRIQSGAKWCPRER